MVSCTVVDESEAKMARFLVFDELRLILVEPEMSKVGFGIVKVVAPMEFVLVLPFICLHLLFLSLQTSLSNPFLLDTLLAGRARQGRRRSLGPSSARSQRVQLDWKTAVF